MKKKQGRYAIWIENENSDRMKTENMQHATIPLRYRQILLASYDKRQTCIQKSQFTIHRFSAIMYAIALDDANAFSQLISSEYVCITQENARISEFIVHQNGSDLTCSTYFQVPQFSSIVQLCIILERHQLARLVLNFIKQQDNMKQLAYFNRVNSQFETDFMTLCKQDLSEFQVLMQDFIQMFMKFQYLYESPLNDNCIFMAFVYGNNSALRIIEQQALDNKLDLGHAFFQEFLQNQLSSHYFQSVVLELVQIQAKTKSEFGCCLHTLQQIKHKLKSSQLVQQLSYLNPHRQNYMFSQNSFSCNHQFLLHMPIQQIKYIKNLSNQLVDEYTSMRLQLEQVFYGSNSNSHIEISCALGPELSAVPQQSILPQSQESDEKNNGTPLLLEQISTEQIIEYGE